MSIVCHELLGRDLIKIFQDSDGFSFSLDSILLASFATVNQKTEYICDLCSGNAPVCLYLSLRTKAQILGVEVQHQSCFLANMSIRENNLENQIRIEEKNLLDLDVSYNNKFDLVTVNPPFFKVGENLVNPNDAKAIARHELLANLEDIIKTSSRLLNNKGRMAMVHRPERLPEILEYFKKYHLAVKRIQFVYPKKDKEANSILVEGIKGGNLGSLRILPPLYVYDNGKWTDQILQIFNYEKRS